jgi:hypothetical protein
MSTQTEPSEHASDTCETVPNSHVEALRYAMEIATKEEFIAEFSRVLRQSQHLIDEQMITLLESCCNAEEMGSIAKTLVAKQQR